MNGLYDAANIFVQHPEKAWVIAAVFFALYFVSRKMAKHGRNIRYRILLLPAIGWTIFGLLELSCKLEKADIRIDLFVTWPAILSITIICSLVWIMSMLSLLARPIKTNDEKI